jgi:alanyl-tRNA synthetase
VFFEMLGNFSFGDYFKNEIIPWSWELTTETFGLDGDRLWITVHTSDDEAEAIWHEQVGVPMDRIQRLGDKDNFWQMGDTGPCGRAARSTSIVGPAFGPDGGPLGDPHGDRFMEFWNLVFMQYNQAPDGSRTLLPKPSIDTGLGLERMLCLLQGVEAVWETGPHAAAHRSGVQPHRQLVHGQGDYDDRDAFAMRVLGRARPQQHDVGQRRGVPLQRGSRGYVLRRIIRRAVRYAYLLGTEKLVMPTLVETASTSWAMPYPDVSKNRDFIVGVLTREEERFRQTLKNGLSILEDELERRSRRAAGLDGVLVARHLRASRWS